MSEQTVLVVDEDADFLREAKSLFDGRLPTAGSLADAQRAVEAAEAGLVVLGPSFAHEAGIKSVSTLLDADPDLVLVVVAGTVTAPLLRAAMRVGVKDVLEAPLTEAKLNDIIHQFGRQIQRRQATLQPVEEVPPPAPPEGRIITVVAAKGGSGKTVVATNLAMLLAQHHDPAKVCIVDADLQFGDVCLVFQLEPKLTIVNAAHELHRLDR
ncbi:MAG: AAA family ATPase, partial [Acidimicrobiia bacterium]